MRVSVTFNHFDDLTPSNVHELEHKCLTPNERVTITWSPSQLGTFLGGIPVNWLCHTLDYTTQREASEVIASWEEEGFHMGDFVQFAFGPDYMT